MPEQSNDNVNTNAIDQLINSAADLANTAVGFSTTFVAAYDQAFNAAVQRGVSAVEARVAGLDSAFRANAEFAALNATRLDRSGSGVLSDVYRSLADHYSGLAGELTAAKVNSLDMLDTFLSRSGQRYSQAMGDLGSSVLGRGARDFLGPVYDGYQMGSAALRGDFDGLGSSATSLASAELFAAGGLIFAAALGITGPVGVALFVAAMAVGGGFAGEQLWDDYSEYLRSKFSDFFTWLDPLDLIPDDTNTDYNAARNWVVRRDPLAIDLDGDGIETIGADGTVLFDHNGDGVKTGTGWIKGDDGLLVLDRNGNGVIDSGGELFGVDTIKSDGRHAFDGFDALRDLDGNGDHVFDANDAAFASVKIWQDLDQDGVTDAGELRSLSEAGIVSIDLVAANNNVNLGNGNVQTASAANLTTSGDEGTTANLDLADNPFFREFTDPVTLTEAALALPDMHGSGMVRDLREAA